MKTPEHLSHKPIVAVDDYNVKDGMYAGNSDAEALSIGCAQYDEDEMSAKIFRHTGNKWSRQSEELPLHRVLDLAILLTSSMLPGSKSILDEKIVDSEQYKKLQDYYKKHRLAHLDSRMRELKRLLDKLV